MKLYRLTLGDIRFQWKYGFYLLYAIFTAVYLLALFALPENMRSIAAAIMIFTDPAAMGLFFMGAIILLEKSQRVEQALGASPINAAEYMLAKLFSLAVIGLLVGMILAAAGRLNNLLWCAAAIIPTSLFCSACGLIAAERSRSLNSFVLWAVPFELFICLPPLLLFASSVSPWLMAHPGCAAIWLIYGDAPSKPLCLLSLLCWCVPTLLWCERRVRRYLYGGEK